MARNGTFHLNPAGAMTGVLDFSSVETRKFFDRATKRLDPEELFDCSAEEMHHFLRTFDERAQEVGWDGSGNGILWIPESGNIQEVSYLPNEYGTISIERITEFEKSYIGDETREAQDAYMVYKCLMNSISKEAKIKVRQWEEEYIIETDNGKIIPSGNLLLKIIIRESHLDTNATTQNIRHKLTHLHEYITTIGCDVTKLNGHVKILCQSLAARGEKTEDLLANLFRAYLAVSDKAFVAYIGRKLEEYEEGTQISATKLMQMADTKFRTLKDRGKWNAPSDEEEKILALQAEINNQHKEIKKLKSSSGSSGKRRQSQPKANTRSVSDNNNRNREKPGWMKVRPADSELLKPRTWNKKEWWYCHPDTGGKCHGEYRRHKPADCEGKSFKKKSLVKRENGEPHKRLKVSEALSAVVDDAATESDDSGYSTN